MSYIAVDLKAIEVAAPGVARALGLDVTQVLGGLVLLWHRCWATRDDRISTLELRGYLPHLEAPALLEAFGLLERAGDVYRVRGADRYLRISAQRSRAGHARSSTAGRSAGRFTSTPPAQSPADDQRTTSGPPGLTPSTEHRTPNEEKKLAGAPKTAPPAPVEAPRIRAKKPKAATPATPGWQALVAAVVAAAPGYAFAARDAKALKACVALASGVEAEVLRRWRLAWHHQGYPACRTLAELERTWNHWAAGAPRPPEAPPAWEGADAGAVEAFKRHLAQLERGGAGYAASLLRQLRPSRGLEGELVLESSDAYFAAYVAGDLADALPAGARVVGPKAGAA